MIVIDEGDIIELYWIIMDGRMVMKISVCIDAVFSGKDFVKSIEELSSIGVKAFEFWRWWDKDIDRIIEAKNGLNMEVSAFCTRFISLVDPALRSEYIEGLKESIAAAKKLGCKRLISQVGNDTGAPRYEQRKSLIEGLKACAKVLEEENITLVFEPLNTLVDHVGYYLYSSEEAFEIADAVGSPRIKVLYDIYHQQIMEGHLIKRITSNIDKIGHFHAAGNPGRHELHIGEINYNEIFKHIDQMNYDGYVGLEYFPVGDPLEGIKALMLNHNS